MTDSVLAIDPGPVQSAYAVIDASTCRPLYIGKIDNHDLLATLDDLITPETPVAIEMVASYGMSVGAEVFDTCVWIGRYMQHIRTLADDVPNLVKRLEVKVHHCHDSRAKDTNITQALIDRFAPGAPNRGKGTKTDPGWFHGFAADIWQAYALAVLTADRLNGATP